MPDLAFTAVAKEPLVVILPSDHPLASQDAVNPKHLEGETFIGVSNTAPVLRAIIDDYLKQLDLDATPDHEADAPAIDLVVGHRRANTSPVLKLFVSRIDELIERVSKKHPEGEPTAR